MGYEKTRPEVVGRGDNPESGLEFSGFGLRRIRARPNML